MPEIVSPEARIGDPTTKMRRLLAIADFQVGGEVRMRSRRESWNVASSGSGAALGGGRYAREHLDLGFRVRTLNTELGRTSRRRGIDNGEFGSGKKRAEAILEAECGE